MQWIGLKLLTACALTLVLGACVPDLGFQTAAVETAPPVDPADAAYVSRADGAFTIPSIPLEQLPEEFRRQVVDFPNEQAPGTIIINTAERHLYYITGPATAVRYGIAVGRAGFDWSGEAVIASRQHWPTWTPPPEMIVRRPELEKFKDGQPGGPTNPLGARALYLTSNGVDYGYRIHGTPEWRSIGSNASSGCIRMINQDVMDLFNRVPMGAKVVVLTASGEVPKGLKLPPPAPRKVVPVEPVVPAGAIPKLVILPPPNISAPIIGATAIGAPVAAPAAATPVVAPELVTLPAPAAAVPTAVAPAAAPALDAAACKVALVNGVCPPQP